MHERTGGRWKDFLRAQESDGDIPEAGKEGVADGPSKGRKYTVLLFGVFDVVKVLVRLPRTQVTHKSIHVVFAEPETWRTKFELIVPIQKAAPEFGGGTMSITDGWNAVPTADLDKSDEMVFPVEAPYQARKISPPAVSIILSLLILIEPKSATTVVLAVIEAPSKLTIEVWLILVGVPTRQLKRRCSLTRGVVHIEGRTEPPAQGLPNRFLRRAGARRPLPFRAGITKYFWDIENLRLGLFIRQKEYTTEGKQVLRNTIVVLSLRTGGIC